ncbi:transcriptional regulator containing an amidase domain and an AraC-type DNA-binding HTH domain [Desulfosporosinus orientis DSM 765]|uniref:Transcriptional regulator containing an amidase domain and an AraC-type DNA-binding HTH domain n=1 Tax=Desulfosporosinus orientis (strain ATCC 19365 / DSM 765 / NCIMB 8382 / VKM B-1628 / Singapore I) TaxID=768706 RepID=G7WA67_DESOD|nr:AraC family transcriptional regulator [Desulfosporosinus orientis]AET66205.1 transcriptional regulator containing an amidase domain and an AraC-type DNA-binding HTH domain [Desulfosporosinus orientis DSM 765]
MKKIKYFCSKSCQVELVYCKDTKIAYPEHNHVSHYIIGLVINGKIQLKNANQLKIISKNDFFIISPYATHRIESIFGMYTMITVCIGTDFVKEYDVKSALTILQKIAGPLHANGLITYEQLAIISSAIDMLFLGVVNPEENLSEEISAARNYLEQAPENIVSIEQLSQSVFISKYHFIREFKKSVGLTPHHFQIQNRIRKAQYLLLQNKNIAEVALNTGFYDQSHFNKWFKKFLGITPTEYILSVSEL